MIKKQINKQKVEVFEGKELKENMKLNEEQIQLILSHQERFPELLQKKSGFCINARNLWESLNNPQGSFADFIKREVVNIVYKEKGKNTKEKKYKENVDYISYSQGCEKPQGGRPTIEYKLSITCAKKISMQQGNKMGDTIQDYFILMEETLRNYEQWDIGRNIERNGWNSMTQCIEEWCKRRNLDYTIRKFYTREANMLNESLLNYSASEINWMLNNNDKITRNHLTTDINNALNFLQELNCSLLFANMNFEERTKIIKTTCDNRYSDLKNEFLSIVA